MKITVDIKVEQGDYFDTKTHPDSAALVAPLFTFGGKRVRDIASIIMANNKF